MGHSKLGNTKIISSSITKEQLESTNIDDKVTLLREYTHTKIPDNIRLITLYNQNQTTNTNTTRLLHWAIKNIGSKKFKTCINNLFDYSTQNQKVENICVFKKIIVTNFLIYVLNKKSIRKSFDLDYMVKQLHPTLSIETIKQIYDLYQAKISLNNSKVWSSNHLISLFNYDFISEEIIELVLNETKINIQIYKPGNYAKFMVFDDLVYFKIKDNFHIYKSGIFDLESYENADCLIWKQISLLDYKQTNKNNLTEEKYFLNQAYNSRSQLNINEKFNRFYSLGCIFNKLKSGTFIIPSCGVIDKTFLSHLEKIGIDLDMVGYY